MPVYNAEKFIYSSIDSILKQTYTNFEFLIFNDASTDSSEQIIKTFQDTRIRYFSHATNKGYIACLNNMLREAKGDFIARMDADDISVPERLEVQINFLNNNPTTDLVSANVIAIDEFGIAYKSIHTQGIHNHGSIRASLYFTNIISHPTVLFRRELVECGIYSYDPAFHPCEDYRLWTKLITSQYRIEILNQTLLEYRIYDTQTTALNKEKQNQNFAIAKTDYYLDNVTGNLIDKNIVQKFYKNDEISFQEVVVVLQGLDNLLSLDEDINFKITLAHWMHNYININFKKIPRIVSFFKRTNAYQFAPYLFRETLKFYTYKFMTLFRLNKIIYRCIGILSLNCLTFITSLYYFNIRFLNEYFHFNSLL